MRPILTHVLCVGLGAIAFWACQPKPKVTVRNFDAIDDLGIRQGDLLLSVNGVTDTSMMDVMADGLKKGDVCIVYERATKKREVCLKRS